jgi:hypothetical protein
MRHLLPLLFAVAVAGCANMQDPGSTESQAVQTVQKCSQILDQKTCIADGCEWAVAVPVASTGACSAGAPCPPSPDCPPGALCVPFCPQGASCPPGMCVAPPQPNPCGAFLDEKSCVGDAKDDCEWVPAACPALAGVVCPAGACIQVSSTGGGTGGGKSGCACPNGEVCVEQLGGPAVQPGATAAIQCLPLPKCTNPDPCACLGTTMLDGCKPSPDVAGLCICDNGIR